MRTEQTMKKTLSLIISVFLLLPILTCTENNQQSRAVIKIDNKALDGFIECKGGDDGDHLSITIDRLFAESVPLKRENSYWSFAVTGEVMGLPIKAINIGVCGSDGSRDCGWGSYLALTIAKPFNEARIHLTKRFGIDFTEEKRDTEYEVTLRPVLAVSKQDGETVLFCDPGTL